METVDLPHERWPILERLVRDEFQNAMPTDPTQTKFITTFDGDKVASFLQMERLIHFVCEYTAPEYRGTQLTSQTIMRAGKLIPPGFSGIWLTDENRDAIARRMGARNMGVWTVYRKDTR